MPISNLLSFLPIKYNGIENKYDKYKTILYLIKFPIFYELDSSNIDSNDIYLSNYPYALKIGKTTIRRFNVRMNEHRRNIKEKFEVIKIIPIESEEFERKFHKELRKYLNSKNLYVDFNNSKTKKNSIELYPFYCYNMVIQIFDNFKLFTNLIKQDKNIYNFFKQYDNIQQIINDKDYMDIDMVH